MAVSKRLRFEVLRRDDFTCRYCGGRAPDVALTVDHVVPRTLGGSDQPENLVAACQCCNSGKTSVPVGAPLVEDVAADAMRWACAVSRAAEAWASQRELLDALIADFDTEWTNWKCGGQELPRPIDWPESIERFIVNGLDEEVFRYFVGLTMRRDRVSPSEKWSYFCGCCWNRLSQLQLEAKTLVDAELTV